jgi:hypothetical protein
MLKPLKKIIRNFTSLLRKKLKITTSFKHAIEHQ